MKAWQVVLVLVVVAAAGAGVWWYTRKQKGQSQAQLTSPYWTPPRTEGQAPAPMSAGATSATAKPKNITDVLGGSAKTVVTKAAQQALGNIEQTAKKALESGAQKVGEALASKASDFFASLF